MKAVHFCTVKITVYLFITTDKCFPLTDIHRTQRFPMYTSG